MTDWDRHYTCGTLRKTKPAEDYYPQTDWGWRLVGWAIGLAGLAATVGWMIGSVA